MSDQKDKQIEKLEKTNLDWMIVVILAVIYAIFMAK